MPTVIEARAADRTPLAPPAPDAQAPGRAETEASLSRRLLERFALIAFGLYHLPLFLNNYPSLGGGGFDDKGLAVTWGHVFTPPGVWVARHVFHVAGPMVSAYQGDNGDVGEEFGRLLLSVAIALVGAVVWTIADRRRPRGRWVGDTLRVLLRYSIALGLASYAIAKILPVQFPPISGMTLEQRVGDMNPMGLLWTFMEYSRPYAFFGGVVELAAVLLLCVRRTATLGAIVCIVVMTNVAVLNYAYGVPVKLYATMIVASAVVLVLYDTPRLLAVFVSNRSVGPSRLTSLFHDRISPRVRWPIKIALVGSVMVSSVAAMRSAIGSAPPASPLEGAWVVTSFSRDATADSLSWRRVVVQGSRLMIQLASDARMFCQRVAVTPSALTLGCSKREGTLRWTRDGDVLQLDGTFDGARVVVSARHLDRSDYPLLRSKFRWISDR